MTALATPPAATALSYRAVPIPATFANRVRAAGRDDFGRPVRRVVATGGEPMRDQLRRADPGEVVLLGSYQAVALPSLFAEIGPVFVSAEPAGPAAFPADTLPPGYFNRTFALRAYNVADEIIESCLTDPADAPAHIRRLLAQPGTAYLHARFAGHGCYACRFERAG